MLPPKKQDLSRASKTIYVTGFNHKNVTKRLLEELFSQGGPVKEVILFETHAFVQFQHEESVPYCLALFNDIELHGQKLRLSPRRRSKTALSYLKYLMQVRDTLMAENRKITPPELPQRQTVSPKKVKKETNRKNRRLRQRTKILERSKTNRRQRPNINVKLKRNK